MGFIIRKWSHMSERMAVGMLNHYHFGAKVCQQFGAVCARDVCAKVQNVHISQGGIRSIVHVLLSAYLGLVGLLMTRTGAPSKNEAMFSTASP